MKSVIALANLPLRAAFPGVRITMVISDHYIDLDNRSWFIVKTPEYDITENILAQHMLSMDPSCVELYRYCNPHLSSVKSSPVGNLSNMNDNVHNMVMDYFEVNCNIGAFDLIETAMISNEKPTTAILQTVLDLLLKERDANNQYQFKEDWILIEKAHDLLLNVFNMFGSDLFAGIWDTFDQFHLGVPNEQRHLQYWSISNDSPTKANNNSTKDSGGEDNDDATRTEEFPFRGFKAFKDLWDFAAQCFTRTTDILQAKSYNHVLDILVALLEEDFRSKKDNSSSVKKTIFLKTLQKNVEGKWDQFGRYIDILLLPFHNMKPSLPDIITLQKEMSGRLLNLIIAISQYEGLIAGATLAEQIFRKSIDKGINCFIDLLECIYFDTFIVQLCQYGFKEADWSTVPKEYHYIKWENNITSEQTSSLFKRWVVAFTKTKPDRINWESIYLHLFLIKQYYQSILKISTIRFDSTSHQGTSLVITGYDDLDDVILFALLDDSFATNWRRQVTLWAKQCQDPCFAWEQRIDCLLDTLI
ncbi:hypothetical protein BC941DRAFT_518916 [Chlamydoabsidia padenii]|nr:hypothetical protein BC941DRAFT_518916 [Chlamydoabsidia padenii]